MAVRAKGARTSRHGAKVSVSLPAEVLAAALARVESGQSPSLSALVAEALAEKVAREETVDRYREWLRQMDQELGPPSPEAYAWAREALGL